MSNIIFVGGPVIQCLDKTTGAPLSGGFILTQAPGFGANIATYPTYVDAENMTNPLPNPVPLNSAGFATICSNSGVALTCTNSLGVLQWSTDNFNLNAININDSNNNPILLFNAQANAQNQLTIANSPSGSPPSITATGNDINIGMNIDLTGTSTLSLNTGSGGTVAMQGNSTVAGNSSISGTLAVTGTSTLTGNTTVTGTSTLHGNTTVGGTLGVTGAATITGALNANISNAGFNLMPSGMLSWFAMSGSPAGWLACDGSAVSRATFSSLFTAIGITYGSGDGSTTFNLPTSARRALVGSGGSGTGTLGNTVGSTGGAETTAILQANLPTGTVFCAVTISNQTVSVTGSTEVPAAASASFNNITAGTAINIIQPSLVAQLCIKI